MVKGVGLLFSGFENYVFDPTLLTSMHPIVQVDRIVYSSARSFILQIRSSFAL